MNRKAIARHEAANASAAAHILRTRTSQPVAMVRWAEACQRRQRGERATKQDIQACQQHLPLQGVA